MIYVERIDLGRNKECLVDIGVIDDMVVAKMSFVNNGTNTYTIGICKDTDNEVIVPQRSHKGKPFPEYVKKVLNALSELVLPSIYYKECVIE